MEEKIEQFVKDVYATVVQDALSGYKDMYVEEVSLSDTDLYSHAIHMYQQMNPEQQKLMMHIIEVVMVDTVSHVFGLIDGSSGLIDSDIEATLLLDDVDTEGELQDSFIGYLQEEDLYP
ncbi:MULTISPECIES: transposase [Exiguobacterium]|uniref:transposase n=1 Tax=Exiguobacterium TaxID=33986 RepID=UPI001BE9C537|nr:MULTISPECIES: transposase [Exiguobacterium]MCT4777440.1 transposase [Exiguobacterium aquaticum]MCT4788602.1 transposase [Exiguobacterium mexicanum]